MSAHPSVRSVRNIEIMDEQTAEHLRRLSGAERLQIAGRMFTSARAMLVNHLRTEHPDWSESRVGAEASRRLSHGAG